MKSRINPKGNYNVQANEKAFLLLYETKGF
jgi:hypothetical protein